MSSPFALFMSRRLLAMAAALLCLAAAQLACAALDTGARPSPPIAIRGTLRP